MKLEVLHQERRDKEVYRNAVSIYVFAHCMVWPNKPIDKGTQQATIRKIYEYLKPFSDLDGLNCIHKLTYAVYDLYKNAMFMIVNSRYGRPHPATFISLLDAGQTGKAGLKQKGMRKLRKAIPDLQTVVETWAEGHFTYTCYPDDELVELCLQELCILMHYEWIRRFRKAIAIQRKAFGHWDVDEMAEEFMNAAKMEQATRVRWTGTERNIAA